jgi:hypothetical protein
MAFHDLTSCQPLTFVTSLPTLLPTPFTCTLHFNNNNVDVEDVWRTFRTVASGSSLNHPFSRFISLVLSLHYWVCCTHLVVSPVYGFWRASWPPSPQYDSLWSLSSSQSSSFEVAHSQSLIIYMWVYREHQNVRMWTHGWLGWLLFLNVSYYVAFIRKYVKKNRKNLKN